jgi:tetratricopeptide (TPR) repeat protein
MSTPSEPTSTMVDELLARVRDRLDAFQRTRDASVVLSDSAAREAAELWQATFGQHGSGPVDVLHALAYLAWYRYAALPAGPDELELRRAAGLFGVLEASHPDLVPTEMKVMLHRRDTNPGDDPMTLLTRANELLSQAQGNRNPLELDWAIDLLRRVLDDAPPRGSLRDSALNSLSVALTTRYDAAGDLADQDEAIAIGREMIAIADGDSESLAMYHSNLSVALRNRFHRSGDTDDLDGAVRAGETAVRLAQDADAQAMYRSMLGLALRARGTYSGSIADLDIAVDAMRSALGSTPAHSRPYATRIGNFISILKSRYDMGHDLSDLDEAVAAAQHWLNQLDAEHVLYADALRSYAQALYSRFESTTSARDLEDAVAACRDALSGRPSVDAIYLLEQLLRERFQRYQDPADLDGAISAGQQALQMLPDTSPMRAGLLSHLCMGFRRRFVLTGDRPDIDAAVETGRQAVALPSARRIDDLNHLNNLAGALHSAYEHTDDSRLLDEAISITRRAIELTPPGHPYLPSRLANLANALVTRWSSAGNPRDLDDALSAARSAIADGASAQLPDVFHQVLGRVHHARFKAYGRPADARAAFEAWDMAAASPAVPAIERLGAARNWAELAGELGAWEQALGGYVAAIDVLPVAAWRGLDRIGRERLLTVQGQHLGTDGATAALYADRPDIAIQLVEQGRGVLWGQLLDTREDFIRLSAVNRNLAEALDRVREEMNRQG